MCCSILQDRKDMLQLMLNAHKDTDRNEIEETHTYENPEQWKKRGIYKHKTRRIFETKRYKHLCDQVWYMSCTTVGLTVEEITGNSILFLLAGFDTTASTMTFMTYNLATNPECQDRLIEEIDSVLGTVSTFKT